MIKKENRNTSKYIAVSKDCYEKIIAHKNSLEKKGIRLNIGSTVEFVFSKVK